MRQRQGNLLPKAMGEGCAEGGEGETEVVWMLRLRNRGEAQELFLASKRLSFRF